MLAKHEDVLKRFYVSLEAVKREFETSQDWRAMQKAEGDSYEGVGFRFSDLNAFYKDCVYSETGGKVSKFDIDNPLLKRNMDTLYENMTDSQKSYLSNLKIPAWELIIRNSGGHPSITNISGLNFLKYNKRVLQVAYGTEKYTDVLKKIARDIVDNLKQKIDDLNAGNKVSYDTRGVELLGQDTNENFDYQLVDKTTGQPKSVTKEEFLKAGSEKGMRPDRKSLMTIDNDNKRVIAKFESFNNSKQ